MSYRDSRNILVWGEECQSRLQETSVVTVGSDLLAQMVLSGLAGLGIGHIYFIDNDFVDRREPDFLLNHSFEKIGQKKVRHIEDTLKKIKTPKQDEEITGTFSKFSEAFLLDYSPNIVVECTNDPISKEKALAYTIKYGTPFISASASRSKSAVSIYMPPKRGKIRLPSELPNLDALLMKEFEGTKQGGFTSGVIASIALEEIRKLRFRYDDKDRNLPNNSRMVYNIFSESRKGMEASGNMPLYFKDRSALVVGAGGIGTFVALSLALQGFGRIDVIDMDVIEGHNLNRQILFYEHVGEKKAETISKRVREINPDIKSDAILGKVGRVEKELPWLKEVYDADRRLWGQEDPKTRKDNSFPDFSGFLKHYYGLSKSEQERGISLVDAHELSRRKYDAVFGCFDNKYARLWLNNFAVANKVPYFDGGTGPKSGQIFEYVPGKTNCINCQSDLIYMRREPMSCDDADGSVVMPNMNIGSAMVGEAVRLLCSIGEVPKAEFRYRAISSGRMGIVSGGISVAKMHNC
ncbi:ThiF family adenylyltransferase [Candidatus Woesearchaeota archaeon]|nr:ThiF family adenylyltransferase [Candidatus Woesearchaeota archaeon]